MTTLNSNSGFFSVNNAKVIIEAEKELHTDLAKSIFGAVKTYVTGQIELGREEKKLASGAYARVLAARAEKKAAAAVSKAADKAAKEAAFDSEMAGMKAA